jgi:hypothetical protein
MDYFMQSEADIPAVERMLLSAVPVVPARQ